MADTNRYQSWGRYPTAWHKRVESLQWRHQTPTFGADDETVLPYGYGRSYGDSCLNNGGVLLDTTPLNQLIAFDRENGLLCCEAGLSVKKILDLIVPHGWFLPVSPGTKFVTVGGAIANDVHGKNHHVNGSFGCHVTRFELLRSNGERLICTPTENADFFAATIGGLGLTGIITWAEIKLKPIPSPLVDQESIQFHSVDEFFELSRESMDYEYIVSWVDCTASGRTFGRGVFGRGDFYDPPLGGAEETKPLPQIPVPVDFPDFTLNPFTVRVLNELYFRKQIFPEVRAVTHYEPFFYPLDVLSNWNRGYGKRGFLQYQFVMPYEAPYTPIKAVLRRIVESGQASPLVVFKTFGEIESPGMLSFPRPGVTLALDFAYNGPATLRLLDELDEIVFANGGALYPAKDARMSPEGFRCSYPRWEEFSKFIDPKFSSSFWRRVMG